MNGQSFYRRIVDKKVRNRLYWRGIADIVSGGEFLYDEEGESFVKEVRSGMLMEIGTVEEIYRYPVKSMRGEPLDAANLGWHGLDGDRRLALRKLNDHGGFPWLTATKLPDLIRFAPLPRPDGGLPTHVCTPEGQEMPVFGEDLAAEIERRHGAPVQMMHLRNGIFDDGDISVIALETIHEISRLSEVNPDTRRFRPNVVVRALQPLPFQEDGWLGSVLQFGEGPEAPTVAVTMPDLRCSMVNLDPDTATPAPKVMKAIVAANQNYAGVYGTITRTGQLRVGQTVFLRSVK